jgi:hypothetical protein
VRVNNPFVDGSLAWVVATILTTAASLSAIVTVAADGDPMVTAVLVLFRVTITVSPLVSTILSSITGTETVAVNVLAGITTVVPILV